MKKLRALLEPFWDLKIGGDLLSHAPLHCSAAIGDMGECFIAIIYQYGFIQWGGGGGGGGGQGKLLINNCSESKHQTSSFLIQHLKQSGGYK